MHCHISTKDVDTGIRNAGGGDYNRGSAGAAIGNADSPAGLRGERKFCAWEEPKYLRLVTDRY